MKSNKWKFFLLTGAATLTLLTACSQASSQSATKSNTAQTTTTSTSKKIKQTIPTILQIGTRTALMMKAKPLL